MRLKLWQSLFLLPLLFTSSCVEAKNMTKGKSLYLNFRASCHGIKGKGDGPVASELKKKPRDLTTLREELGAAFEAETIKTLIDGRSMPRSHGLPEMPIWGEWFSIESMSKGRLQEDQEGIQKDVHKNLDLITDYIISIQK